MRTEVIVPTAWGGEIAKIRDKAVGMAVPRPRPQRATAKVTPQKPSGNDNIAKPRAEAHIARTISFRRPNRLIQGTKAKRTSKVGPARIERMVPSAVAEIPSFTATMGRNTSRRSPADMQRLEQMMTQRKFGALNTEA